MCAQEAKTKEYSKLITYQSIFFLLFLPRHAAKGRNVLRKTDRVIKMEIYGGRGNEPRDYAGNIF